MFGRFAEIEAGCELLGYLLRAGAIDRQAATEFRAGRGEGLQDQAASGFDGTGGCADITFAVGRFRKEVIDGAVVPEAEMGWR